MTLPQLAHRRGRFHWLPAILMPPLAIGAALLAVGCARAPSTIEVRFAAQDSGDVNRDARTSVVIRNLQFYVHDVQLRGEDGGWRELQLVEDGAWRSDRVALIDLTSAPMVRGRIRNDAAQSYTGVRFTLGVPFELNHANPLTAEAPLDRGELFWSWQLGYKFLRAELVDGEREGSFHLGSTGCVSASSVRAPAAPCAQPNRVRVELQGFDPSKAPIEVRLEELLNAMRSANYETCTGAYAATPGCELMYSLTGLDLATGACVDEFCRDQRLFVAGRDMGA